MNKLRFYFGWACGILAAGLFLTDFFGGPTEHVRGLVQGHHYTAAHDDLVCSENITTKVMECHNEHYPAQYWLFVRTSEGLASVSTDEAGYATAQNDQVLTYTRARTRWSDYTWGDNYNPDQD